MIPCCVLISRNIQSGSRAACSLDFLFLQCSGRRHPHHILVSRFGANKTSIKSKEFNRWAPCSRMANVECTARSNRTVITSHHPGTPNTTCWWYPLAACYKDRNTRILACTWSLYRGDNNDTCRGSLLIAVRKLGAGSDLVQVSTVS